MGAFAPGPVLLRGMGNGRPAVVAAQVPRHSCFGRRDPRYLEAATRYLKEVGRVLGPLQVTKGGPILMVQVENEYGFFGERCRIYGRVAAGAA